MHRGLLHQQPHQYHLVSCFFLLFRVKIYACGAVQVVHGVWNWGLSLLSVLDVIEVEAVAQLLSNSQTVFFSNAILLEYESRDNNQSWEQNAKEWELRFFLLVGRLLEPQNFDSARLLPFSAKPSQGGCKWGASWGNGVDDASIPVRCWSRVGSCAASKKQDWSDRNEERLCWTVHRNYAQEEVEE